MKKVLKFLKKNKFKNVFLYLSLFYSISVYFIKGENLWLFFRKIFLGFFGLASIFMPIVIFCYVLFKNSLIKKINIDFKRNNFILFTFLPILLNIFVCVISKKNIGFNLCFFKDTFFEGESGPGILCAGLTLVIVCFFGVDLTKIIMLFLLLTNLILIVILYKIYFKIDLNFILKYFEKIKFKNESKKIINVFNERDSEENENSANALLKTLESFGVSAKIINISRGPSVTRYEIQPAPGVKLNKITSLSDNIALSLSALGVRIEAPIPGKSAVGIEIPNKIVSDVNIKELIKSKEFLNSESALTVVLGKDISGNCIITDLAKMPHLLIAGSTGSGKSVCVNSFIASLLYKSNPNDVKLLMIDPKVVELSIYNGVSHLLTPVVTDPKKAAGALFWAVEEMLSRYKVFAEVGVRDLESYNKFVTKNTKVNKKSIKKMERILIIIDELADLMIASPKEIEDYICRLAQMARAAGMHLIIATQRPSVDVITGVIKANVPSRIALAVSSQVDSRTIIDTGGAEKLIGRGDMLFSPLGSIKPIRVQGCYIDDEEVQKIINNTKKKYKISYDSKIIKTIDNYINYEGKVDKFKNSINSNSNSDFEQSFEFKEAAKCVIESGITSASFLNKNFGFGYEYSSKIIKELEKIGVIGFYEINKPRKILMNYEEFLEKIKLQ